MDESKLGLQDSIFYSQKNLDTRPGQIKIFTLTQRNRVSAIIIKNIRKPILTLEAVPTDTITTKVASIGQKITSNSESTVLQYLVACEKVRHIQWGDNSNGLMLKGRQHDCTVSQSMLFDV